MAGVKSGEISSSAIKKQQKDNILKKLVTKIKDFWNYLVNTFKGSSSYVNSELKYARKMADKFNKLFNEVASFKGDDSDNSNIARYNLKTDRYGNKYWYIETGKDIFKDITDVKDIEKAAYDFLIDKRDRDIVYNDANGKYIKFIRLSADEFTNSDESNVLRTYEPELFKKKMRLIPSLEDLLLNYNVEWHGKDMKDHKLFKEGGFDNYRGRVRIDNVIFKYIVRVGKAKFGNIFYDINLEVDSYLPHTQNSASDIKKMSTSNDNNISQPEPVVKNNLMQKSGKMYDCQ